MDSKRLTILTSSAAATSRFGFYQFTRPASPVGLEVLR
jgi:hypothetical protein